MDELKNPGDPEPEFCAPGSIEQQLDMCEEGSLRGDEVLRASNAHEYDKPDSDPSELNPDEMESNYRVDMAEEDREGDEESGDEHSSGYQGISGYGNGSGRRSVTERDEGLG